METHLLLLREAAQGGGYKKCETVTKAVRERTINAVEAGHFARQKQDDNITISTKRTSGTGAESTSKKGRNFAVVEEDDEEEDKEDEDLPLPTYEEYLRENGVISLNVGDADCTFDGDGVSEFGIGCVQVGDSATPAATKGIAFAGAEE